ncbi:hypothetical protein T9A_02336 [Alcanivorax jadensis T9]|jgi:uncharacterized membrane protein YgdD (TMEM256/DUF423 family)|uniref:DUF423 domain-containing protein n=1 Tax=Alcanivorax jadensis T9 TaxID=1177181 RepID=A0ABR4WCB2_9GAMM|nr:DUF423 domain-containing protein [Alcanivorax jadensis]KGD60601.1 hypothetical protein T9A_02336 [Alcanivorax jadensis T9]MBP21915.1 DUF423 domain-containing protein [Alcanivorax sp.]|tara:strand:+ start:832 stop:1200 length:369 start_codon:yes stop_codon:yes gene_type:complete
MKILLVLGALNGALAVILGAFGAHGLKSRVDESMLAVWSTASEYHFYHALAMLLCGLLARAFGASGMVTAGWVLFAGTLVFSGSLYVLVLSGQKWIGAITPLGGTALIIGWLMLAWSLFKAV